MCDMYIVSDMWPDRREFGVEGMSMEDEFMALREICFTELPSLSLFYVLGYSFIRPISFAACRVQMVGFAVNH